MSSLFQRKYPFGSEYPAGEFGLLKSSFFHGLDLYEEMVHSIATREVIIRSSRGLAEPGTLFKNLMAILRDVVICYDGSVRNISSNSIILFDYGFKGEKSSCLFPAGEPVGVLAATAMSNPAYKAVLDSSPSSNSSWEMMKEILFCRVNFRNDTIDRRVILYLNDCDCGGKYCRENASYLVKNLLKKVSLRDAAVEFLIEYRSPQVVSGSSEIGTGLIGHIHLNQALLNDSNISMHDVLQRCQDEINIFRKKKKNSYHFKRIILSVSECCFFEHGSKSYDIPCLKFFWQDMTDSHLEKTSHIMADMICPVLLDTIIKGDPRISTVNIIWISPDTTTWIQGPCKSHKGELAVEVVLEKKAVKQSGDAWRIVLDCCLPVFHLIDTVRSIPYAIKQIQDLLGISCTFDQAVQRLSTSVTMVAKGVLKEHLILLASSMTSTGNLIGFNMGGIKALCRALGVQVPFTEATLYTPRKCFERAAEKCHMDSLSSIVASCSWGKRVAVGTGAKFDILWERKETGMNLGGFDIYNFLQLVRGSNEEEMDTGCLDEEIENFELEDGYMEQELSPERDSNAVFEENAEIESGLGNQTPNGGMYGESGWDKVPSSSDGKGWNTNKSKDWSSWEQPKAKSQVEDSSRSGGWSAPEYWKGPSQSQTLSTWGEQVKEADETGFNKNTTQHSLRKSEGPSNCKSEVGRDTTELSKSDCWKEFLKGPGQMESAATWENQAAVKRSQSNGKDVQSQLDWDSVDKQLTQARQSTNLATNSWNASPKDQQKDASSCPVWNSKSAGWESELGQHDSISKKTKHETSASWGPSSELHSPVSFHWGSANDGAGNASVKNPSWGQTIGSALKNTDLESINDWDSSGKIHQLTCSDGWDSGKDGADNEGKTGSIWGQTSGSSSKKDYTQSTGNWGSSDELCQPASSHGLHPEKASSCNESETGSSWGQPGASTWKKNNNETAHVWGSSNELHQGMSSQGLDSAKAGDGSETETKSPWGNPGGSAWKSKRPEIGGVWGSSNELHQGVSSQDLDSVKAGEGSETETKSPWGHPGGGSAWKSKRPETGGSGGSWGSSNSGEWKNKKNRPPNSPRTPKDSSISVPLTATRQRLDVFTSDEQDILSEVEEIMLQIRKIMHQAGYIDGDRLSADYQSYILSNVFNHHPDKEIKMGAGIDYIMVSRHSSFQDSRCFYVVSTDGQKEDFSYRHGVSKIVRNMETVSRVAKTLKLNNESFPLVQSRLFPLAEHRSRHQSWVSFKCLQRNKDASIVLIVKGLCPSAQDAILQQQCPLLSCLLIPSSFGALYKAVTLVS
ncbi:hypothetical protein Nepgr_011692 [Nepenthes gracilis]|uniref:DNA-directed RNA polymerase n=1 Tax=Nepenthes gracilis TaxID=150966 RepID=A0AAD3SG41_NEPGR|nr:hypothetical protein Nepgr_011692 [Nepenthes gracilis]